MVKKFDYKFVIIW